MEKINIGELLKNCPTGMELDCTICDNVCLDEVTPNMIKCFIKNDVYNTIYFHHDGTYLTTQNAKCVIFPKGKTTWEGFQRPFKDGDILATDLGSVFYLNTRLNTDERYGCYVGIGGDYSFHVCEPFAYKECCGLATEEEKQKLFKVIEDNGYCWNDKTKTLEKLIEPKFKVGDQIVNKKGDIRIISKIMDDEYHFESGGFILFRDHDYWKLVSIVPKFKVGDRITNGKVSVTISHIDDNYYYEFGGNIANRLFIKNQDDWELVPNKFDITTLKPFDKVLVRDTDKGKWKPSFWGFYDINTTSNYPYICVGCVFSQCIPYEGNEHLLGTTDECAEYYQTWK